MYTEQNTKTNLPAQIELYADRGRRLQVSVHGQGRRLGEQELPLSRDQGAAESREPAGVSRRQDAHARHGGVPALSSRRSWSAARPRSIQPEGRQARRRRATSTRCRPEGNELGHGFPRPWSWSSRCWELSRETGIGAQFGGKYFCHDVRVIRLPRHGASCPVAIAVSCSADRQALAKITKDGIFLEQLEPIRRSILPRRHRGDELGDEVVRIDLGKPMNPRSARRSRKLSHQDHARFR